MIVALARKLLIALWHLVRDGVVPEGVVLPALTAPARRPLGVRVGAKKRLPGSNKETEG